MGSPRKNKKIMDPVFWMAMCKDCNFNISTQRRLNMYLKYHCGTLVTVDKQVIIIIIREVGKIIIIREVGNEYIAFTTFEKNKIDGKRILYSYHNIDTRMIHSIKTFN
jgi:hypothetical protein